MAKYGHKLKPKKETKVIELDQPADKDGNDSDIDNEEEGGEWITEENLHKHLTHGDIVPLVDAAEGENVATTDLRAPAGDEESKEEEEEFPAFDENALPALDELDRKEAELKIAAPTTDDDQTPTAAEEPPSTTMINTTVAPAVTAPDGKATVAKKPHPIQTREGSPKHVIFLTADFAMQNVILQMGFTLITLDGFRLTRVKRYKLICRACMKLNLEVERQYCLFCGSNLLGKVSCFINEDGQLSYFDNPRRRINLRGTIYSIPKPK